MPAPLWQDARDYLVSQGAPLSSHGLNDAMTLLASNPDLRPSYAKAGGGTNSIAAGLGAPMDQVVATPLAAPVSAPLSRSGGKSTQAPPPVRKTPATAAPVTPKLTPGPNGSPTGTSANPTQEQNPGTASTPGVTSAPVAQAKGEDNPAGADDSADKWGALGKLAIGLGLFAGGAYGVKKLSEGGLVSGAKGRPRGASGATPPVATPTAAPTAPGGVPGVPVPGVVEPYTPTGGGVIGPGGPAPLPPVNPFPTGPSGYTPTGGGAPGLPSPGPIIPGGGMSLDDVISGAMGGGKPMPGPPGYAGQSLAESVMNPPYSRPVDPQAALAESVMNPPYSTPADSKFTPGSRPGQTEGTIKTPTKARANDDQRAKRNPAKKMRQDRAAKTG